MKYLGKEIDWFVVGELYKPTRSNYTFFSGIESYSIFINTSFQPSASKLKKIKNDALLLCINSFVTRIIEDVEGLFVFFMEPDGNIIWEAFIAGNDKANEKQIMEYSFIPAEKFFLSFERTTNINDKQ